LREPVHLQIGGIRLALHIRAALLDPPFSFYRTGTGPPVDFRLTVSEDQPPSDRPYVHHHPADIQQDGDEIRVDAALFSGRLDMAAGEGLFHQLPETRDYRVALQIVLSRLLAGRGGWLAHGCGLVQEGQGWLFLGPSGAGKSTVAALADTPVLGDELCVVSGCDSAIPQLHGTPLGLSAAAGPVPLAGLFWLEQAPTDAVQPIPPADALPLLMSQMVSGGRESGHLARLAELAGRCLNNIELRRLRFTRSRNFMAFCRQDDA